jgi:hypothetical protein
MEQIQSGGQNQNGRQSLIFHSSLHFYANQLKLEAWKERLIKKIVEWRIKSRCPQKPMFFFLLAFTLG